MDSSREFIYCQHDIPKQKWRYGFRSSAATGCGWIATYNALLILGKKIAPEKLIRFYERQFPFVNGNTGTFLFSPLIFFKRHGFVRFLNGRETCQTTENF